MSTTLPNVRVYEPGRDITAEVTAAPVTIKRFVKIAGNRTGAGNLAITTAGAGERAFGVAAGNAAVGQLVRVARGGVVKVTATGAIAAGAEVQVGAGGTVTTKAAGIAVGYAVTGAADTFDAQIALY